MAKDKRVQDKKEQKISAILPTDERLTGRAGLALSLGICSQHPDSASD